MKKNDCTRRGLLGLLLALCMTLLLLTPALAGVTDVTGGSGIQFNTTVLNHYTDTYDKRTFDLKKGDNTFTDAARFFGSEQGILTVTFPDLKTPVALTYRVTEDTVVMTVTNYDDLPDGTLVVARRQTAGRGRRGRSWLSPPGINFTGSILLKRLEDGFHAGCLLGVAALSLLRELAPELPAYLKWPNDIYVRNRKICGILIENTLCGDSLTASVIGIGLNVNQKEFPPQLLNPVSMAMLTGREYDLKDLLPKLCRFLKRRLGHYDNAEEYVSRLYRVGTFNEYVVCSTGASIRARIVGVTDRGLLCLETEKGERLEFAFKEISYVI